MKMRNFACSEIILEGYEMLFKILNLVNKRSTFQLVPLFSYLLIMVSLTGYALISNYIQYVDDVNIILMSLISLFKLLIHLALIIVPIVSAEILLSR
jgi:hypothetical protein